MEIDVGGGAIDRNTFTGARTSISKDNPANASGEITSVEIWCIGPAGITGCKVGIFYKTNGDTLKCRSACSIGAVAGGSKQTSPVSLAVVTGDYIGMYWATGNMEVGAPSANGRWQHADDHCVVDDETEYTPLTSGLSIYGTGEAAAAGGSRGFIIG